MFLPVMVVTGLEPLPSAQLSSSSQFVGRVEISPENPVSVY